MHVAFVVLAECVPLWKSYALRKVVGESYLPVNSIAQSAIFLWVLLGNVWFYDCASSCRVGTVHPDFEAGYTMTLAIFLTYYCVVALLGVAMLVVAVLVCVGNAVANRAKYATMG